MYYFDRQCREIVERELKMGWSVEDVTYDFHCKCEGRGEDASYSDCEQFVRYVRRQLKGLGRL